MAILLKYVAYFLLGMIYVTAVMLQAKLFKRWMKKKSMNKIGFYLFFTVFTCWMFFSALIALFMLYSKMAKDREKIYKELSINPTNQGVDKLITFIDEYFCENKPQEWNRLRAVWLAVNESSAVTTDKKKQLKQFLMLQGLRMHHNDAQIIDNYAN